jgi:hypothetical protein
MIFLIKNRKPFILLILLCIISVSCKGDKIKTELYFGLSNADGPIAEEEWNSFKTGTLDKTLEGYTLIKGNGYWKGENLQTYTEETIILVYLHDDSPDEEQKINSVIEKYKKQFRQESVLQIDEAMEYSFK